MAPVSIMLKGAVESSRGEGRDLLSAAEVNRAIKQCSGDAQAVKRVVYDGDKIFDDNGSVLKSYTAALAEPEAALAGLPEDVEIVANRKEKAQAYDSYQAKKAFEKKIKYSVVDLSKEAESHSKLGVVALRKELPNRVVVIAQGGALGVAEEMKAASEEGLLSEWYVFSLKSFNKIDKETYDPVPFAAFDATGTTTFKRDNGEDLEVRIYKITEPKSLVVHDDAFPAPQESKRGGCVIA